MHTVKIIMHSDQEITINGEFVNVHDLKSITLNSDGVIVDYLLKRSDNSDYAK